MRYLRLLRLFAASELQLELAYRVNLMLVVFEMLLVVGTSVGAVLVLFTHTNLLNGWTLDQMLVLLGCYYLIQGAANLVLSPSIERLLEHIRLGTLDFILLKPVSAQFFVSTRHLQLARVGDFVLGTIVLIVGLARSGQGVDPPSLAIFALTLVLGFLAVYSLLLTLATLGFWFVRVENLLAIFWAFIDAGRFPIDIYPGWLRITLATIVPIGIAVTVPAQAIAGRLDPPLLAVMVSGTGAGLLFASWFWRLGLRSYTGASA